MDKPVEDGTVARVVPQCWQCFVERAESGKRRVVNASDAQMGTQAALNGSRRVYTVSSIWRWCR